ncbi:MAG: CgeB family protein [Terriglobales bacterium]
MHLAIFGLTITSSWGNGHATTYRGLCEGMRRGGHTIEFFERDVAWYARHRDLPEPSAVRLSLYREWAEFRSEALRRARAADAVMVGSYFPDAIPLLEALLGHTGPPVCFYDIDTPITLATMRRQRCQYLRPDLIPALDLYLSFTGGPILAELRARWGARRVRPLYCACDERAYRRGRRPRRPQHALTFLGTYAPDRTPKLQRLLLAPARLLPAERFQVAGSMYPDVKSWPANVRYSAHLAPDEHPGFYCESRFTLNLTRQAMVEAGYSPSVRLFEAAAAATPIITDRWPGLTDFFEPGRDILVADDTHDVTAVLHECSERQAEQIGRAAQDRVLSAHTCQQRALELEGYLQELARPEPALPVQT